MDMSPIHHVWPKPPCKAQWKGKRRHGRQKKRCEDNIREWTGLEFAKSQRAVENSKKLGKLVVKSSVVPQRPPWLRDRWRKVKVHTDHEQWTRSWTEIKRGYPWYAQLCKLKCRSVSWSLGFFCCCCCFVWFWFGLGFFLGVDVVYRAECFTPIFRLTLAWRAE